MSLPDRNRAARWIWWSLAVAASASATALLVGPRPLGVVGEWVWNRAIPPPAGAMFLPVAAFFGYCACIAFGARLLRRSERSIVYCLPLLMLAGGVLQAAWMDSTRAPFGLERWPIALHNDAVSGYFSLARRMADERVPLREFLANYHVWIRGQDNFHVGTHPPGLIAVNRVVLDYFQANPAAAEAVSRLAPGRWAASARTFPSGKRPSTVDGAVLLTMAALAFLLGLATTIPIYALARAEADANSAWFAASLWPIVPGLLPFLPIADCTYPFLAASAAALMRCSVGTRGAASLGLCLLAGFAIWLGMLASLAFLVVAPIGLLSIAIAAWQSQGWRFAVRRSFLAAGAVLAGVALPTAVCAVLGRWDLVSTWRTNLAKHAGFYAHMPRSYWKWLWIDLVEFAISAGPPAFVLAIGSIRRAGVWAPLPTAFFAALVALDLSGKNLAEVARLWLFLAPFAAAGFGVACQRLGVRGWTLWSLILLQAAVAWAALANVEPLMPVPIAG